MQRRCLLAAGVSSAIGAATLARPALAQPQPGSVLRFVPAADLPSPDPLWSASPQSRDHGFLVFDTLFGLDAAGQPQMQMLENFAVTTDAREWRLRLRAGLSFHTFERVLARDCVASIRRWAALDPTGRALMDATDTLTAADDRTILFRLKTPFPMLPEALAKTTPRLCAIMPARIAATDPNQPISEIIGSGPYIYVASERVPGARVVYARYEPYIPTRSPTERTAGAKEAFIARIEWQIMADPDAAQAALLDGKVDWWAAPPPARLATLAHAAAVRLKVIVPTGSIATLRLNHLLPPFDNPAIRRALLGAVSQSDYMTALNGPEGPKWRDGVGFFCPDTPMATSAGMAALTGPRDLDAAKRAIAAAGYDGSTVALLAQPGDQAMAGVTADLLGRLGMTVKLETLDAATFQSRIAKPDPVAQGGWNLYHTSFTGAEHADPIGHSFLRGTGRDAAPGWPTNPRIETMRAAWLQAPDRAWQKRLAEQIQLQALLEVPYIPLGQSFPPTAIRANISGVLDGLPIFWNIRRV